jgi:hypothetical protein
LKGLGWMPEFQASLRCGSLVIGCPH